MSRGRLAMAGGAVLVLLALAAVRIATNDPDPIRIGIGGDQAAALESAPCPARYEVLRAGRHSRQEVASAKDGRFTINGEQVFLQAPIDWTTNPQDSRAFKHQLFKLQWLDPLIYAYRTDGDRAALQGAIAIALDFGRANPPEGDPVDPDVWDDKRTGDRAPYLAYLMRAGACEGMLDSGQQELMLGLMSRSVEVLTDPANYKGTNHSLFADIGLTLLARQLEFLPEADAVGALGRQRFVETLGANTFADEGFWLEHSSGYQILVTAALGRYLQIPGNSTPALEALRRRMQGVVGWLREPDGKIPQFGDSDLKQVPRYADRKARSDRGILDLQRSGLAIAKAPGAYLATMASYFSDKHKHADALTFDLFDRGRRLITDTGLYSKDKGDQFAFAHATRAHSVLTVDGEEFLRDGADTYGSGIGEAGRGGGFYAIEGTNPGVERQGVSHRRLFLYEPHRALVIVDRVEADAAHRYVRFLQFAPGVDVRKRGDGLILSAPGLDGAVTTNGAGGERIELAKGDYQGLRGLTSPSFRKWVPRWTARFRSKGTSLTFVTTITLAGPTIRSKVDGFETTDPSDPAQPSVGTVTLKPERGAPTTVEVAAGADRLSVSAGR